MSRNLPECGLSQQYIWEKMEEMWNEGGIPESDWVCDSEGVPEELSGFSVQESEDYEVERFARITMGGYEVEEGTGWPVWTTWTEMIPTWALKDNMSAYFTNSGEERWLPENASYERWLAAGPVTLDETHMNDLVRSEGGGSDYGDDFGWSAKEDQPGGFYSQDRPYKVQERHFHQILKFIWDNKEDKAKLRKGWKRMWARVYQCIDETQLTSSVTEPARFLFQKQINMLRDEFRKAGITSAK